MGRTDKTLAGKSKEKRPLGRPGRRWDGNIKIDFKRNGFGGVDWVQLTTDHWLALVKTIMI
jgi:hypothetical protein